MTARIPIDEDDPNSLTLPGSHDHISRAITADDCIREMEAFLFGGDRRAGIK